MHTELDLKALQYPIGEFVSPENIDDKQVKEWIEDIALFPSRLIELVEELKDDELAYIYRPEGWSILQLIHHCADSHMNSFIRFKLALTEDTPTIRPYLEDKWAKCPDTLEMPIETSLQILTGLHARWSHLLNRLTEEGLKRTFVHPEHGKQFSLAEAIGMYAWHCYHHLAHVSLALKFKGEF
ncbi:YfiT family bacillithiol transferase [Sediminitomix flava]|uniref:DinB family protein n=1 Tax=Sediminitomix flava TaxID=379075 RepID=A0A315Z669_SEDFL|nr:putative metal-dependent hydrolase [Sediminitomix flava]PWJ39154.1 DinB family protein [Sediminitomix flava]